MAGLSRYPSPCLSKQSQDRFWGVSRKCLASGNTGHRNHGTAPRSVSTWNEPGFCAPLELGCRATCALGQRPKFFPDHGRVHFSPVTSLGGKATIGAGDYIVADDEPR